MASGLAYSQRWADGAHPRSIASAGFGYECTNGADINSEWLKRSLRVLLNPVSSGFEIAHIPSHYHLHMHEEHAPLARMITAFLAGEPLPGALSESAINALREAVQEAPSPEALGKGLAAG